MDPDTVIALGSLVHDLLGLVGGIILCYFGYRLMMRRIKAHPNGGKWSWNAAKILLKNTAPGTMFALLGAIQIWLTAAKGLHADGSKSFVDIPNPVANKSGDEHPIVMALGVGDPGVSQGLLRLQGPLGPASTSGVATVGASGASVGSKIAPTPKSRDVVVAAAKIPRKWQREVDLNASAKPGRKNLEKQRMAVERKRSRLEAMYQKGTISSEAYKSGEDEYRIAIQRYRNEVNAAQVDEN
jgi:hypothetical protein